MSFTVDGIAGLLNAVSAGTWWLQLHAGAPGANGANNANGPRAPIHFGAPTGSRPQHVSSDGTVTADGAAVDLGTWVGATFPLADEITHWSVWDADAAGTCWARGPFGGIAGRVAFVSSTTFTTPTAHAFAAGDFVEVHPVPGLPVVAPFDADLIYAVTTAGLTTTAFSLSLTDASGTAIAASAAGGCIVQKIVPVLVNTDDPVRVTNGEIVLYLE